MSLHTGGEAFGAISTRSTSCCSESCKASDVLMTPSCSPSIPMSRTSGTRISPLMRCAFSVAISRTPRTLNRSGHAVCKTRSGPRGNVVLQALAELLDGHDAKIDAAASPNGHLAVLAFLFAHHEDVRELLHAVLPNFTSDLFAAQICFDPKTLFFQA